MLTIFVRPLVGLGVVSCSDKSLSDVLHGGNPFVVRRDFHAADHSVKSRQSLSGRTAAARPGGQGREGRWVLELPNWLRHSENGRACLRKMDRASVLQFVQRWYALCCSTCIRARERTAKNSSPHAAARRPKLGLALSGGSALAVSHIGVLKALEELRVPISYVTGTSMGAIIGGLYASGMSPGELEQWFRAADWHYLLSDHAPRASESLRNKERAAMINQGIEFKLSNDGLKLPAAFVAGRNIMAELRRLTVPVRDIEDFDNLPVPFRALATDLENGELVVLGEGDLVESIRASMSIPGVFLPRPSTAGCWRMEA